MGHKYEIMDKIINEKGNNNICPIEVIEIIDKGLNDFLRSSQYSRVAKNYIKEKRSVYYRDYFQNISIDKLNLNNLPKKIKDGFFLGSWGDHISIWDYLLEKDTVGRGVYGINKNYKLLNVFIQQHYNELIILLNSETRPQSFVFSFLKDMFIKNPKSLLKYQDTKEFLNLFNSNYLEMERLLLNMPKLIKLMDKKYIPVSSWVKILSRYPSYIKQCGVLDSFSGRHYTDLILEQPDFLYLVNSDKMDRRDVLKIMNRYPFLIMDFLGKVKTRERYIKNFLNECPPCKLYYNKG
jgi:hypothetical protein